mgnify:CR=1 FL=1
MKVRTFFIGDVHGCYDELMALCEKIGLQSEDQLYFVWDLINKWPKSLEVVEFVRNRPNTKSVIGNHEYFSFPDIAIQEAIDIWRLSLSEGAKNWIRLQKERSKSLESVLEKNGHIKWLQSLPTFIEQDEFIIVHAGIHPEYGMSTPAEVATMIRMFDGKPWYEYYSWDKLIIYGHWAAEWLRIRSNTVGLDTGCCFGGHLTAYCLETKEIWQIRANAVYKEPTHWNTSHA